MEPRRTIYGNFMVPSSISFAEQMRRFFFGIWGSVVGFGVGLVIGGTVDLALLIMRWLSHATGQYNFATAPMVFAILGTVIGYFWAVADSTDGSQTPYGKYKPVTPVWLVLLTVLYFGILMILGIEALHVRWR